MRQPQDDHRVRRVAVLIGSSLAWREQLTRGIASYANAHGRWHIYSAPEGAEESIFFSKRYQWDGLIVRPTSPGFVRRVQRLGAPVVSVGSLRVGRLPRVRVDDAALVKLGLDHLLSCGLRQFGYCGQPVGRTPEERGQAFVKAVQAAGYPVAVYQGDERTGRSWQQRQRALAAWLRSLAKPVGVLAWNPDVACELVEACHVAGLSVPDEVAVLASDDDPAKCELTRPTVSGVPIPAGHIGQEAAALLDQLIAGRSVDQPTVLVPPSGVVRVRESTNLLGQADRDVHAALQFMRENLGRAITIDDVARSIHVSRRWLERHFQRVLGLPPYEALRRERMDRARRLLIETELTAERIAKICGFASPSHFGAAIRRETGLTPMRYRQRYRIE